MARTFLFFHTKKAIFASKEHSQLSKDSKKHKLSLQIYKALFIVLLMKILLTGSTGLLGSAFLEILQDTKHEVLSPTRAELNIANTPLIKKYIEENPVDIIVHCAAYTAVDQAETDWAHCAAVNIDGITNLLETKIPIIHFSTDYVFNAQAGDFPNGIPEDTQKSPLNKYGESKASAEKLLEQSKGKWWNIRTSWLYGEHGKNFIDIMQALFESKDSINVVADQIGRLTYDLDLVHSVVDNFIEAEQPSGHYHLQNNGTPVSWAQVAEFVKAQTGASTTINHITSDQYPTPAKRPKYSVLENTKLPKMPNWEVSLKEYLEK